MKVVADIIGLVNDYPLVWKDGDILPSSGDSIWLDGFLTDRAKELLKNVKSSEIWDSCREDETVLWTVCEEEMVVKRRGFYIDTQTKEMVYVLILTCKHLDLLDEAIDVDNY